MRGYGKAGVVEKIRAAGGEIYAVTSEPQALASRAQAEWDLGFEAVGDPHHEIAGTCRDRGWLDLFFNPKLGLLQASASTMESSFDPQHPKGYYQPGVLALSSSSRVLYRWRCVPTHKNMGGATERPTAEHVWSEVNRALAGPTDAADAAPDTDPPLDSRGLPWPLFASLLIANGWFIRPLGFVQTPGGPTPQRRILRALLRLVGFVVLWGVALWWLPTLVVAGAFALWTAWIAPKLRILNDEFQDLSGHV